MKKIKIIELLNKIANGEAVPTIEYNGMRSICYYLYDRCGEQCDDRELKNILNYEVEIIEEKKLPEKLNIEDDGNTITLFGEKENEWTILDNVDVIVCNKINSIIDYLESKEKGE